MIQASWLKGDIKVVCATIAYGMLCLILYIYRNVHIDE
jgi:hypothetical protein